MASVESSFFKNKRNNAENGIQNPDFWEPSPLSLEQSEQAFERVAFDLDNGIVESKFLQREKAVHAHISQNCFQNKDYNFLQGMYCEKFHHDNDFKLKLIKSFSKDHLVKHEVAYQKCIADSRKLQGTVEDKDRHFLACHDSILKNLRENVANELELRARQLF